LAPLASTLAKRCAQGAGFGVPDTRAGSIVLDGKPLKDARVDLVSSAGATSPLLPLSGHPASDPPDRAPFDFAHAATFLIFP
jgi:hypothetical protein